MPAYSHHACAYAPEVGSGKVVCVCSESTIVWLSVLSIAAFRTSHGTPSASWREAVICPDIIDRTPETSFHFHCDAAYPPPTAWSLRWPAVWSPTCAAAPGGILNVAVTLVFGVWLIGLQASCYGATVLSCGPAHAALTCINAPLSICCGLSTSSRSWQRSDTPRGFEVALSELDRLLRCFLVVMARFESIGLAISAHHAQ